MRRVMEPVPADALTPAEAYKLFTGGKNRIMAAEMDGSVAVRHLESGHWYSLDGGWDFPDADVEKCGRVYLFEDHHDFARWLLTVEVE